MRSKLRGPWITGDRGCLEKAGWNKAKAARSLGINRATLYRKMQKYNLSDNPTQR